MTMDTKTDEDAQADGGADLGTVRGTGTASTSDDSQQSAAGDDASADDLAALLDRATEDHRRIAEAYDAAATAAGQPGADPGGGDYQAGGAGLAPSDQAPAWFKFYREDHALALQLLDQLGREGGLYGSTGWQLLHTLLGNVANPPAD